MVLEPSDFGVGPAGPDPSHIDLIDQKTWASLTSLPDDVSIRTSSQYGSLLHRYWDYWGEWSCLVGSLQEASADPTVSPIAHVTCDASDEFQASIYNALVGFYRTAFSCLRNVLEQTAIGCQLELAGDSLAFEKWLKGEELGFGWAADMLPKQHDVSEVEDHIRKTCSDDLFHARKTPDAGGFARRLFRHLSGFTHGAPGFTDAEKRQSNGPLFVPSSFEKWANVFAKTMAMAVLLSKLAKPEVQNLTWGSSLTVGELFQRVVTEIPAGEDGYDILRSVLPTVWQSVGHP
jgi:hypothetical protein